MPSTDLFLALSLILLACVLPASLLTLLARRAGWGNSAVRRTVWTGAVTAFVLLIGQAAVVIWAEVGASRASVDQAALDWFVANRDGWATGFAIVLAAIGGTAALTVLTCAAVLVLVYFGHWQRALLVAGASAGSGLLVIGFKNLYDRNRPPRVDQLIHYGGYSLPSGHALGSIVVFGVLTAAALPVLRRTAQVWVVAGAAALVLLVGWCRVYLGAHWVTDVLTGWLLGGAWLTFAVTALALMSMAPDPNVPAESDPPAGSHRSGADTAEASR
jgi:membrane-associated phospholipid phosphatase